MLFTNFYTKPLKIQKCVGNWANILKAQAFLVQKSNNCVHSRCFSEALHETKPDQQEASTFLPFREMIHQRKNQAHRTILVQVQSAQSYKELHSYCSQIGTVNQMLHYSAGVEPMHFILVEFGKESDLSKILQASSHLPNSQVVPVSSQFLWFRAATSRKLSKLTKASKQAKLTIENGTEILKENAIKEVLQNQSETFSEQMIKLHELTKLNDVGTRLRFLVARQIEEALSGMFPNAVAYPFGSSVNGCGKMGCDLDLVLRLNDAPTLDDSRLIFHCKASAGSERTMSQRQMETIGDIIQLFLPGCAQVRRILQARVPIIKYYQQLADVECDLSLMNMSGVHMSDFLYIMGSIDYRIRPLVFTIRKWAHTVGLTNSSPGRWITNFSLTLLVLAFLQRPGHSLAVLPSLNYLVKHAEKDKDKYVTEEGVNCTFLRDVTKIKQNFSNEDDLKTLLLKFFEYYANFDFSSKALCLNEGIPITKPEHSALYIVNPLERGLNVSKNVSLEELEKFRTEARNAVWLLESQGENRGLNWGVLGLFESKTNGKNYNNFYMPVRHGKLLEVSTLFDSETGVDVVDYKEETNTKLKKVENVSSKNSSNSDESSTNVSKRKNRR